MLTVGLATMLVGGWRALRQNDLKRLLAFGTVSQLGFLMVLLGAGTPRGGAGRRGAAARPRPVQVDAVPDRRRRRPRDRHPRPAACCPGLGRRMPVLAVVATLAALSMAGVPPLLGFISKEAAYEAFLHGGLADRAVFVGLFAGLGAHRRLQRPLRLGRLREQARLRADAGARAVGRRSSRRSSCSASPASCSGCCPAWPTRWCRRTPTRYPREEVEHLALWHGLDRRRSGWSVADAGRRRGAVRPARAGARRCSAGRPACSGAVDADRSYDATLSGLDRLAARATGVVQSGSLPVYLGTVLLTLVAADRRRAASPARASAATCRPGTGRCRRSSRWSSRPPRSPPRARTAASPPSCSLGAVGYGVAVLFVLQGGPDLALTQFLVETLSLVLFVFVLRRLPSSFPRADAAPVAGRRASPSPSRSGRSSPAAVLVARAGAHRAAGVAGLPRPVRCPRAAAATSSTSSSSTSAASTPSGRSPCSSSPRWASRAWCSPAAAGAPASQDGRAGVARRAAAGRRAR